MLEFYTMPKISEFYVIIAPNIFPNAGGGARALPAPSPTPMEIRMKNTVMCLVLMNKVEMGIEPNEPN